MKCLENTSILVKLHFYFSLYMNIHFCQLSSWQELLFAKEVFLFPREPMLKELFLFEAW